MGKDYKMLRVDGELWNRFRKKCVFNDTTMTDVLTEFIKKYVGESK